MHKMQCIESNGVLHPCYRKSLSPESSRKLLYVVEQNLLFIALVPLNLVLKLNWFIHTDTVVHSFKYDL